MSYEKNTEEELKKYVLEFLKENFDNKDFNTAMYNVLDNAVKDLAKVYMKFVVISTGIEYIKNDENFIKNSSKKTIKLLNNTQKNIISIYKQLEKIVIPICEEY